MADQDNFKALLGITLPLLVHLGDQRTGGVKHRQTASMGDIRNRLGDTVRTENRNGPIRYFIQFLDESRALGGEIRDHPLVVHDLMAHINRWTIGGQRRLDDINGALDTGAESAWFGENDFQQTK